MRFFILLTFVLFGCAPPKQEPSEMIIGKWLYVTAERLGEGSQNDKSSIAAFNKNMDGKVLIFYKDSTYKATQNTDGRESLLQTGKYSLTPDGKSMTMENMKPIKISLTDSIFKFYSPNMGAFVWRKLRE